MFHVKRMDGRFIFWLNFFLLFYLFLFLRPTFFDSSLLFLSISFSLYSSLFLSQFSLFPFVPLSRLSPLFLLFPLSPFPSTPLFLFFSFPCFSLFDSLCFSSFASLYFSVLTLSFSGFKSVFYHMFHVKHYRITCQPIPFSNLSFKQSIHFWTWTQVGSLNAAA